MYVSVPIKRAVTRFGGGAVVRWPPKWTKETMVFELLRKTRRVFIDLLCPRVFDEFSSYAAEAVWTINDRFVTCISVYI